MSDETIQVPDEEWNMYKNSEGHLDLLDMYVSKNSNKMVDDITTIGMRYLTSVMTIRPVSSRQIAALALVHAATLDALNFE